MRPKFNIKIPPLLEDLIKRCWDTDPTQRPTTREMIEIIGEWYFEMSDKKDTEFVRQMQAARESNKLFYQKLEEAEEKHLLDKLISSKSNQEASQLHYPIHPSAIYTSRLLDFKNLSAFQNSQEPQKANEYYCDIQQPTLQLDEFTLGELNLEDNLLETKIQVPPK